MRAQMLVSVPHRYLLMTLVSTLTTLVPGIVLDASVGITSPRTHWAMFDDHRMSSEGDTHHAAFVVDTDGDGLSDDDEISTHDTDPLEADTDRDGLSDGHEVVQFGSDPLSSAPDRNNNGLTDYAEAVFGPMPEEDVGTAVA